MLKLILQRRVQSGEKKRFEQLAQLVENPEYATLNRIRRQIEIVLGINYELCQTGQQLWIYRKFNHSAVAVISEI